MLDFAHFVPATGSYDMATAYFGPLKQIPVVMVIFFSLCGFISWLWMKKKTVMVIACMNKVPVHYIVLYVLLRF